MHKPTIQDICVLSVDFYSRGFGYAVFEGPDFLLDWGLASVRAEKEKRTLERIESLIGLYRPDIFVTEDMEERPARRCQRIQQLAHVACELAMRENLAVHRVSQGEKLHAFSSLANKTKRGFAVAASNLFPELRPLLPPERKPWMSEDERINMFDAVVLGCTHFSELSSVAGRRSF